MIVRPLPFSAKQTRMLSNPEIGLCIIKSGADAKFVYAMCNPLLISGAALVATIFSLRVRPSNIQRGQFQLGP